MPALPHPDRPIPGDSLPADLQPRQAIIYDPTALFGKIDGPDPGLVAGIVLASVGGFLLLLWLISLAAGAAAGGFIVGEEEIVVRRSRSPRSSRRSRGTRTVETREISRSPSRRRRSSGPPSGGRRIVDERIRRSERDRRVDGDDIIEVFEEHASDDGYLPRRQRSRYRH